MKRYSLEQFGGYYKDHRMEEDEVGDWVRFEDFQALLEDRDRLRDQLKQAEQGRDVWMRVAKKHPPAGCGSCGVDACCPPEECAHKPMFDAKREDAFKAGYRCQLYETVASTVGYLKALGIHVRKAKVAVVLYELGSEINEFKDKERVDEYRLFGGTLKVVGSLVVAGIPVKRYKIERIVYDSKTGVNELRTTSDVKDWMNRLNYLGSAGSRRRIQAIQECTLLGHAPSGEWLLTSARQIRRRRCSLKPRTAICGWCTSNYKP